MPFGATKYPHEKEPGAEIPFWAIIILIAVILVLIVVVGVVRSEKKSKKNKKT